MAAGFLWARSLFAQITALKQEELNSPRKHIVTVINV